MKLIMAIINSDSQRTLLDAMARNGFSATVISTTGGFLDLATQLFSVACPMIDTKPAGCYSRNLPQPHPDVTPLPPVMEPGEAQIPMPVEKQVGGATVFVLNIEHFEKI